MGFTCSLFTYAQILPPEPLFISALCHVFLRGKSCCCHFTSRPDENLTGPSSNIPACFTTFTALIAHYPAALKETLHHFRPVPYKTEEKVDFTHAENGNSYEGQQQAAHRWVTAGLETKEYHCDSKSRIIKLSLCPANDPLDSKRNGICTQCLQTISSVFLVSLSIMDVSPANTTGAASKHKCPYICHFSHHFSCNQAPLSI